MPDFDIRNIRRYAQGRDIDAIVEQTVNGLPEQPSAPQSAAIGDEHSHSAQEPASKPSWGERVFDPIFRGAEKIFGPAHNWPTLGSQSDAGGALQDSQLAASGLQAVRESLGADAAGLSDAQLESALGPAVVAQIGREGFPEQEVQGIQQAFAELNMDKLAALQTYAEACNCGPGSAIELTDAQGNARGSLDSAQVLAAAGLEPSEIEQIQAQQLETADKQAAAEAEAEAEAEMVA